MDLDWAYFVFGLIIYQTLKMLYKVLDHELRERRQRRFLRAVRVIYPNAEQILFTAVDTSDRKAMAKLKEQIEDAHHPPRSFGEVEGQDGRRDR